MKTIKLRTFDNVNHITMGCIRCGIKTEQVHLKDTGCFDIKFGYSCPNCKLLLVQYNSGDFYFVPFKDKFSEIYDRVFRV